MPSRTLSEFVSSHGFHHAVLGLILANAALIGLETSPSMMTTYGAWLRGFNWLFQAAFVLEIGCRLAVLGRGWPGFFRDGWNTFDFVVVAASLVPAVGAIATVARLARVLRVLRLVSAFPDLRLIVATMLRSVTSMGHVTLLLGLLLYVYGVVGYHLFHDADPGRWGSLGRSVLTLFEVLTLEGWVEMQEASMQATPWAWAFYMSFIVIAVFIVINLFIAVVINNLEAAKRDERAGAAATSPRDVLPRLEGIRAELDRLAQELAEQSARS
jgi:voltage-gated sodium channel